MGVSMRWVTLVLLFSFLIQVWRLSVHADIDLRKIHQDSLEVIKNRQDPIRNRLQLAKLKPATNSYVHGVFPKPVSNPKLENATILMLCRNWELSGVLKSMRSLEDRFNKDYHYTWTFLNDVPFTDKFIEATTQMASGPTQYGLVPAEDWNVPAYVNETKMDECLIDFENRDVIYGGSRSYRNMCHFNSGFFFKQELVQQYDYYFRVEPEVEYFCDFQMDPFRLLRENKKKYGFVMTLLEYENTIPSLWNAVEDFMNLHPEYIHPDSLFDFVTNDEPIGTGRLVVEHNSSYNLAHFWSNFEIGDLNFFRSEAYESYFDHLSRTGGFHYERWGDAPVHSIAVALLMNQSEIHHFEDIGYTHAPFATCPTSQSIIYGKRCVCSEACKEDNFNVHPHSCLPRYWKYNGKRFLREYYHEEDYI
ncbi:hypothetical protein OGAPHI_003946 [Ogataea philodendri]|uniref:Mannosyltransferase n=1 Tax=Ogataea philodendri TaxID=1378263 RepID=A0A9P8P5A1_9ASCO|nr:uncharacterized protein OGAPHI_003946 [Ogataea philodendri]KAH3665758.1 hypothetical protein OGAPHI_003946 [Ogataea philodendri]